MDQVNRDEADPWLQDSELKDLRKGVRTLVNVNVQCNIKLLWRQQAGSKDSWHLHKEQFLKWKEVFR